MIRHPFPVEGPLEGIVEIRAILLGCDPPLRVELLQELRKALSELLIAAIGDWRLDRLGAEILLVILRE
ncbi:MAG: hypothetical protein AAF565_02955 [Pseudomonadota bacterium]